MNSALEAFARWVGAGRKSRAVRALSTRGGRRVAALVAMVLLAASPLAHAQLAQGVLQLRLDSQAGLSDVYWTAGEIHQPVTQENPCGYSSNETLLHFQGLRTNDLTSYTPTPLGAKQDTIGTNFLSGNGTSCSALDRKGNTREALQFSLRNDDPADALYGLNFEELTLELELKGNASAVARVETFIDASPVSTFSVRGGSAADGSGRPPGALDDPRAAIDCFSRVDVAPDARDTCIVRIRSLGDRVRITTLEGTISLEGGKSTEGFTELRLTEADGTLDCGDIVTLSASGTSATGENRATCRRLENLTGCAATSCIEIPYSFGFGETTTNRFFELLVDEGDQCPAYQCQFEWSSEAAPLEEGIPVMSGEVGAGPVFSLIDATTIQFLPTDDSYRIEPCLGEPMFHAEVALNLTNPASTFAAGDTITINGTDSALVLSFVIDNGTAALVYQPTGAPVLILAGDAIVGPNGTATAASDSEDSTFISLLGPGSYGVNPAGAGYNFPDLSVGLDNVRGVQYGCSRSRTTSTPEPGMVEVEDDVYIQGDITFARGR